jgi:hypothetical protein
VPDTVATNQEGADLKTVDLLDKGIEGGNLAGGVASPSCHPGSLKSDCGDNGPNNALLRKVGVPEFSSLLFIIFT